MQAEGMCRGVLRAAIEGFATEERRRACARVVSAVGCRGSGQDGGVVITEAAREEGLHSMVGYVREGVRVVRRKGGGGDVERCLVEARMEVER